MRKIVLATALLGALGFVPLAHANEDAAARAARDNRQATDGVDQSRHHEARDRDERREHTRSRHDEGGDRWRKAREPRSEMIQGGPTAGSGPHR